MKRSAWIAAGLSALAVVQIATSATFLIAQSPPTTATVSVTTKVGTSTPITSPYSVIPTQADVTAALRSDQLLSPVSVGNRYVNVAPYGAPGDGTNQNAALSLANTAWFNSNVTALGAQYPLSSARALFVPSGNYRSASALLLDTAGTGSSIFGFGSNSRLDGDVSVQLSQTNTDVRGLSLTSSTVPAGTYGIRYINDDRRASATLGNWIRDKGVGVQHDGGAQDIAVQTMISRSGVGIRATAGGGWDNIGAQVLSSTYSGINVTGGGENRFIAGRVGGSCPAMWVQGTELSPIVENYMVGMSLSGSCRSLRTFPILAADNDNGYVRLQTVFKQTATVVDAGGIMTFGAPAVPGLPERQARNLVRIGSQTTGSLLSLTVDGTQTITAPVAAQSSSSLTATAIANAINAGGSGYTAQTSGSVVLLFGTGGAASNGKLVVATTTGISGELTVTPTQFIRITYPQDPGSGTPLFAGDQLVPGDDVRLEGGTSCHGVLPVAYAASATVIYAQMPAGLCASSGDSWKIFRMTVGEVQGLIANNGGTSNGVQFSAQAVSDTTVTTDILWGGSFTIASGASVSWPGWDLIYEAVETGSTRINDQFVIAGNINRTLIKSANNIAFVGTRLKVIVWVDDRANAAFKSDRITRIGSSRGRQDPSFGDVRFSGVNTGIAAIEFANPTGASTPGNMRVSMSAPCNSLPTVQNSPQWNSVEVTEVQTVITSCGQALVLDAAKILQLNSTYDPNAQEIFDALAALGVPATASRKTIINNAVLGYKNCNTWQNFDVLYHIAAADSVTASVDWKHPSNAALRLVMTGSMTFTADRGWTGNNASYLSTGYNPTSQSFGYALNSASAAAYILTAGTSSNNVVYSDNSRLGIRARNGAVNSRANINVGTTVQTVIGGNAPQEIAIGRLGALTETIYRNGVVDNTGNAQSNALPTAITLLGNPVVNQFTDVQLGVFDVSHANADASIACNFAVKKAYLAAIGAPN